MAGLWALVRRHRLEQELEDEVLAHLELAERDALAQGLSPEEARRIARQRFGGVEQMKEEHRDRRGIPWLDHLVRDLRFGLRAISRAPAFAAVVIGVLALGIGANVAMFSVVDAVLLKPLPFPAPERLVRVWEAPRPGSVNASTAGEFLDWRRLGDCFDALSAEQSVSAALNLGGQPIRLLGKAVTADYFRVFGVEAAMGRTFLPDEDQSGANAVVVLSHAAWQTHFGHDPQILNRRLLLDGQPHQVVGVLRPGAFDRDKTLFWKPLAFTAAERSANNHWLTVYGRLKEGLPLQQAQSRMQAVHAALTENAPQESREATLTVQPLGRLMVGNRLSRSISVLFAAVLLVLLIASANVANLLLAKGAARRRELAVRSALGASRGRLVTQLLTESLVLCFLGGAAGLLVAVLLLALARPMLATMIPFTADVTLDWRVMAFAAAAALSVALLAGVLPALRASFGQVASGLSLAARGSSGSHSFVRRAIVVTEVALSLILVCGAMLLFRSLLNLQQLDTGIRTENVITLSLDLPREAYRTPTRAALFYQELTQRLESSPGIRHAALTTQLPLQWILNGEGLQVPGAPKIVRTRLKRVDAGYFPTLGIPMLSGRGFTSRDVEGAPLVVVINEAMAAHLAEVAGLKQPVGQRVRLSLPGYNEPRETLPEVEIVGVIRSERVASPGMPDPPVSYAPLAQAPNSHVSLLVKTDSSLAATLPIIRRTLRDLDPNLPLDDVAMLDQVRSETLSGVASPALVIGAFALVAVLLAGIGLYGVLAQLVVQQRREIGIRLALGARAVDERRRVVGSALVLVAAGLAFGLAGSVGVTRVIANLLYEVSPLDPLALSLACATMTVIGLLAGYLPARRASLVDPVDVLREDG